MMTKPELIAVMFLISIMSCNSPRKQKADETGNKSIHAELKGQWVRQHQSGLLGISFENDSIVHGDFGNDKKIDLISKYVVQNDTIIFMDQKGKTCPETGTYRIKRSDYYIALDLIHDDCGGRIQTLLGFWVRPDYQHKIGELDLKIKREAQPIHFLNRGRMYLALGKPAQAKDDLDEYIKTDSTDADVYVNRAGTRFHAGDLTGIIEDCDKAISLDPVCRNAFFLRGLALYATGEEEQACEDFYKSIELGFSILEEEEKDKCSEYWEKMLNE